MTGTPYDWPIRHQVLPNSGSGTPGCFASLPREAGEGRGASVVDWLSAVVTVVSAAIAVYAAYWARRSARGTFAHSAYELARTLHADLTTGATAQARDVLEHFRMGTRYHEPSPAGLPPAAETQTVLEAYFALLWCFERILIGRRSLSRQQDWNDTGPAVAFLDGLLAWHLTGWAE